MAIQISWERRQRERGQTILLVALAIVSLLGMAALAIDVVTLYLARTEIQRAADAAALAGAKAIADSGFTSVATGDVNFASAQALARSAASDAINGMLTATPSVNLVAGGSPILASLPTMDFATHPGSFLVTVNLVKANLPTFFSKIFGRSSASVTATATAEAYNPSYRNPVTPIAPTSVKPWLVANTDPNNSGAPFIDKTTGNVLAQTGEVLDLVSACPITPCVPAGPWFITGTTQVRYLPALVTPNPKNVCPSTCGGGSTFEEGIECADASAYAYLSCGGGATNAQWDASVSPGGLIGATATGAECLIHASTTGAGAGQDTLTDPLGWPAGPRRITAQSGALNGSLVTTSNSIVAIPIFDTVSFGSGVSSVTVVGYLQAFINQVDPVPGGAGQPPAGSINVTVLNIAGCSATNNGATPITGSGGASPVPVRLITPP